MSESDELERFTAALAVSERERASERAGRIRAERALREFRASAEAAASSGESEAQGVYPLVAIGRLHSCFSQRNGTPRQPLLVPLARSRLVLAPHVPAAALDGLAEFSHCWVLYVFHANTDLETRLGAASAQHTAPGKVHVPRLNGAKRGVLATRSPHRPCPVGLSVAQVLAVDDRTITLGGLDVVDGSPVLDIKPYLPFCDAVVGATAPHWAQAEVPDGEPLAVAGVRFAPGADHAIASEWAAAMEQRAHPSPPLFDTADQFVQLVVQTLSRDIRSAHQRQRSPVMAQAGESAAADPQPEADELPPARGQWRVILDGVNVGYSLDDGGCVTITDAHIHIAGTDEQAILSETLSREAT